MSRVNISGQYAPANPTNAYNSEEVKVERQTITNAPSNWTDFCNAVDMELRSYSSIKTQLKWLRLGGI